MLGTISRPDIVGTNIEVSLPGIQDR